MKKTNEILASKKILEGSRLGQNLMLDSMEQGGLSVKIKSLTCNQI